MEKQVYRVECNFGSKYFQSLDKARAYFRRKADKHLDVELWRIDYLFGVRAATQKLIDYSGTALPKF